MSEWRKDVLRLHLEEGRDFPSIVDEYEHHFPDLTKEQIRRKFYDAVRRSPEGKELREARRSARKSSTGWKNGQLESDRLIEICETENITPELIMRLHNLDPSKWEVVSYRNNEWHSQVKGGKRMVMYQSKITVRPPTAVSITMEDVDRYFEDKTFPSPPPIPVDKHVSTGQILEIDIPDLHSGLSSWARETGEEYNLEIVRERFLRAIKDNVARSEGRKFKRVILALLGDLLHVDNDQQTTTKGTFQQVDGRMAQIFEATCDMLIEAILLLGKVAPVEVIYTTGNHDGVSGWMLLKAVELAFRNEKNVTIDNEPNPQKARVIGVTLVGFAHGDSPESNLAGWIQVHARKLSVPIRFIEGHFGHRHAQKVKERVQTEDREGVIIRTMPTIASSSVWGHRQGYSGATLTTASFVWDEDQGLREMWYSNI